MGSTVWPMCWFRAAMLSGRCWPFAGRYMLVKERVKGVFWSLGAGVRAFDVSPYATSSVDVVDVEGDLAFVLKTSPVRWGSRVIA